MQNKFLFAFIKLSFYFYFSLFFIWISCKPAATTPENPIHNTTTTQVISQTIKTYPLAEKTKFSIPLQTTGFLKARETAIIKSNASAKIIQLMAREGAFLNKGELILALEDDFLQLQLQQVQSDLNEAIFKKNELLIQFDGKMGVDSSVSPLILNTIHIKSGYDKVLQSIKQIKFQINQSKIYAPFNSIVSDVKVKKHEFINTGETVCTLINPYTFEAEFLLLENEALKIKKGQQVKVIPFAIPDMGLKANIVRINPVVNEQGLVKIYAKINDKKKLQLFEGMNVRVLIEHTVPDQLIVPKQALVLRSGKEVIFTYDKKKKRAKWNYVKVAYENDKQLAISEGLNAGDLVIIEGNNNLAHAAEVVLSADKNKNLVVQE